MARLIIGYTWDGEPIPPAERATVDVRRPAGEGRLTVIVEAPYHGDPPPPSAPGPTDRLWEYEVVELFLLGEDEHYLELEFGPHGHQLALYLAGRRRVHRRIADMDYTVSLCAGRWRGQAQLPARHLPAGLCRANAYAIHGQGALRRYLAAHPVMGRAPDFHRLEALAPLAL